MIKNVIFDCGQVLIRYNEVEIASNYTDNEADAEILGKVGMSRKYWELFDRGLLEEADYLVEVKKELPEHLHKAVESLSEEWVMRCPPIPGMEEIVCDVKKAGKKPHRAPAPTLTTSIMRSISQLDLMVLPRVIITVAQANAPAMTWPSAPMFQNRILKAGVTAREMPNRIASFWNRTQVLRSVPKAP